jgi:hypothetical protein
VSIYVSFIGTNESTKGTISITAKPDADNQSWVVEALSATTFSVVGTRSGNVGTLVVGVPFNCDDLTITVSAGITAFNVGDSFNFTVHVAAAPRYVKRIDDGSIINFPGGPAADVNEEGTWIVPRRMFENLPRVMDEQVTFADLLEHFRSVIKSQDGFYGSSFGVNNFRNLETNLGFGGSIREYSSNFQLLLSMLAQRDMSPITLIDFAEKQYAVALSSIDTFLVNELASYIAEGNVLNLTSISSTNPKIVDLLARFEARRTEDENLKNVFSDSTTGVKHWPITLPMMGLTAAVNPTFEFDSIIGITVLVHHDGHVSPIGTQDAQFERTLAQTIVKRSNGTESAGYVQATAPTNPFAFQLWFNTSSQNLCVFDVISDSNAAPVGVPGKYWYRRSTQTIYEWDETASVWVPSAVSMSSLWKVVDTSIIRNSLVFAVEKKLFNSVHPSTVLKYNLEDFAWCANSEIELARFSAKYNYDTYAPDFKSADAFTWNYSSADIDGVPAGTSRWYDIYHHYFDQPGWTISTIRPNLEPWKLLSFATKEAASTALGFDWDTAFADTTNTRIWNDAMWTYIASERPGLKLCVNTQTDDLLPPYVSTTNPAHVNALLTAIPANIDAGYMFGDNGPVEMVWKKSLEYKYGLARTVFREQPLRFIDKTWGETYFKSATSSIRLERNMMRPLPPSLFQLHGEKLHVINERDGIDHILGSFTTNATVRLKVSHVEDDATFFYAYVNDMLIGTASEGTPFSFSHNGTVFNNVIIEDNGIPFSLDDEFIITSSNIAFIPAFRKKHLGFGQIFTNVLRWNSIDTEVSESINAFRNWEVKLSHRIGALLRGDTLKINAANIAKLPETAYSVVLKRSVSTKSKWISALRVQLVQAGSGTLTNQNIFVPTGDASDWIFRVETYNPQHPIAERWTYDTNGEFQTFHALSKRATKLPFKRMTEKTALLKTTAPVVITGLQPTLNFIFGYIQKLTEDGWTINAGDRIITDAETGRNVDWQLEIEKFIDRVYSGMLPGQASVINPFMHGLWLETPHGLMSRYSEKQFIDVESMQAAYDVNGNAIPLENLQVIRSDDSTVTYSDTPMFSAHVFLDEFEHVVLFNGRVSDEAASTTIFNPFLGQKITAAELAYVRQEQVDRKPRFDGFVLLGNDVKRNIVSSIDTISTYYDATRTFAEPTTAKHALSLLGFSKKNYFENLGVSDATQFNFWRGLIQSKGTDRTIDAFANYKKFTDASVDEYWAYKLAEYGDARKRATPEIKIEVKDALQNFTQLQFYDSSDIDYEPLPLFEQIELDDDSRWFAIDDIGNGLAFPADKMEAALPSTTAGYYRLSDIFHNGDDAAPKIYLRTITKNNSGEIVSVVDIEATSASVVNASLVKVEDAPEDSALVTHQYVVKGYTWRNFSKLAPVKLFNYKESTLAKEIALWHPAIGIHAYEPLHLVNSISSSDPALYNTTIQTVDNPNYVFTKPWGKREVGRVWWDTSNLGYIPYYDASIFPDRNERHARWGNLADWSSIDIYEWVESDVPPEEYDELALDQEGQSDIHPSIKASGKSALKNFYKRDRIISMRPVAWSRAGVSNTLAHPSFPSGSSKVHAASGALFVDASRTEDVGLTDGRRFAAWKNNKPYGEVVVGTDQVYDVGSSLTLGQPHLIASGFLTSISVSAITNGRIGATIGTITLSSRLVEVNTSKFISILRMSDSSGYYEDVAVEDWRANSENDLLIQFNDFGLQITVTRAINDFISASDVALDIETSWLDVFIREGVRYESIISLPDVAFVNDITDPDISNYDYGWRAWDIPTQSDLDADMLHPKNSWQPYLGESQVVEATPTIIEDMKDDGLTLKNGIKINRFTSTWTDWVQLRDVRIRLIADGYSRISVDRQMFLDNIEEIDPKRITIYANGQLVSPQNYVISGDVGEEVVELISILPEGTDVLFIYAAKQPTEQELRFDSSEKDDPTIQTEYKTSYQYTKMDVRGESGTITGAKYYFWVQDSTVIRPGKSISLSQAKALLTSGPSQFLAFAKIDKRKDAFDSCVIAGLNALVTNNDTYKLRFVHNETLRDDPEQMALRNVHTEWALLKKSQNSKIPLSLWSHLTNAAAGEDINGNPLPSLVRVDYDAKNGTRSSFGFGPGQILADTELVRATIRNTVLNTSLEIRITGATIPDYITALNFDEADEWFKDAKSARATMDLIWSTARARQINEIFFAVLEDALANNYEFTDIFKTSLISVKTTSTVASQVQTELEDGQF